ncbi:MAG TPA: ABC transporter ATP-binding protein [Candidatus Angelobacter sp.]|nr:ABC transporter ATP-binding protein [Candidatus Angelobacter sp.]
MAQEEEVLGKAYDSRLMKRLLGYLRPYKWQVAVALVSIILKAGADVLGPFLTKTAIDKYLANSSRHTLLDRFLSSQPLVGIAELGAAYLALLLISFGLEYTQTYLMLWTGQKVMFDFRSQIFRHLQRMHIGFYDKNPVGRLVTRVTSDVDALNEMFTSGVVAIFEDIFVLVGIIAIMLGMSWWLALITFSVLPLIFWATMVFRKSVRDSYRRIRTAIARINAYLQEHVTGMVVLQLFNREKRAYSKFDRVNAQHMDAYKDAIMAYALYYPVVEILSSVAIAMVIWFGGLGSLRNAVTIGTLTAFMQYAQRFFRPIQDLSDKYNILQSAMASSERVFKLLDTPVEITSPAAPLQATGAGRIEFDHVWFAYRKIEAPSPTDASSPANGRSADVGSLVSALGENGQPATAAEAAAASSAISSGTNGQPYEPAPGSASAQPALNEQSAADNHDWVLRDVSFTIEPGETIAIVGHTGAGKTTIISLLMRFYDIQRGAIRLDGVDIRQLELTELRRRFGVVLQDPFLFSGTVEQNIRLGSAWITDEQIATAAENVNIADFIRSLPEGFRAPVLERGSTMSTGQKQLISFARALAHDPKILVLDEATSSVDTETEIRVREALSRMVEGRTSVIIAHRLSTIQRADKIIVMHKGQVREIGSHQELLSQRGIYWKLYQLQYKDQEMGVPQPHVGADD